MLQRSGQSITRGHGTGDWGEGSTVVVWTLQAYFCY